MHDEIRAKCSDIFENAHKISPHIDAIRILTLLSDVGIGNLRYAKPHTLNFTTLH